MNTNHISVCNLCNCALVHCFVVSERERERERQREEDEEGKNKSYLLCLLDWVCNYMKTWQECFIIEQNRASLDFHHTCSSILSCLSSAASTASKNSSSLIRLLGPSCGNKCCQWCKNSVRTAMKNAQYDKYTHAGRHGTKSRNHSFIHLNRI